MIVINNNFPTDVQEKKIFFKWHKFWNEFTSDNETQTVKNADN